MDSDGIKSLLSGGVGGVCTVVVGHPLDTVKVRLMTDTKREFKGMIDCLKQTVAKGGFTSLYAGMGAPVVFVTPLYAVYFAGFDFGKRMAMRIEQVDCVGDISALGMMFAGGFSALPGTLVMVPGDLVKVKLQVEKNKPPLEQRFHDPVSCIKMVVKQNGIVGMWKGMGLTLLRDVPGTMANFASYELMKREMAKMPLLKGENGSISSVAIVTAGGLAGVANWIVAVPPDVVKSRLQSAPEGTYPGGTRQVFQELVNKEGWLGLTKGMIPAVTRAFPANAACFLGLEVSRKLLDWWWP
ncbi:hypothetical protein BASA81_006371 [Batrachochytrium salamandrivorans]|nr:hypothetical protein BASA81_006371 [Batrachochytrium salamandrivorans]